MTSICECWNDDVWKLIHVIARISSIKENEEKAAFCTLLLSINQIISCPTIQKEIIFFIEHEDTNIVHYLSSNDQLFLWTLYLRNHVYKLYNKPPLTLEQLSIKYDPVTLKKDVWGPILWKCIHSIPLKARTEYNFCPIDVSIALKAFITCIALLVPCPYCRKHAWEYYSTHSIDEWLDTPKHAFEWTVLFHNNVNEIAQIRKNPITLEQAYLLYKNF
jgi:hypothetical protein